MLVSIVAATPLGAPVAFGDDVSDKQRQVEQIADELQALDDRLGQLEEDHAAALDRLDQLAIEIASGARERATLDLVEQAGLSSDPARFVQQLHLNGRLTPSLIMRALCLGHMGFVEHALAELGGIPRSKAWLMVHDAGTLGLSTTAGLEPLPLLFGQERALAAIDFGVRMGGDGYNLFLLGPGGIGKRRLARRVLNARADAEATPGDWVYVHNFSEPLKPCALGLAPGQGPAFREALKTLVGELADLLPDLYEGEDCRARRQALKAEFVARDEERVKSLRERARAQDVALTQTPDGFSLVPLADGEPMPDEDYEALAEDITADALVQRILKALQRGDWRLDAVDLRRHAVVRQVQHAFTGAQQILRRLRRGGEA